MTPELCIVKVEGRCYPEECLKVVDTLLFLTLGEVYQTKDTVTMGDQSLINSFLEEVD